MVLLAVIDMLTLEEDRRILDVVAGIILVQLPADHHGDQFIPGSIRNHACAHVHAVTQYRHPVADLVQFTHLVTDVDDTHALGRQITHDFKQLRNLTVGNGGSRLIHDQDPAVEGNSFDNFHHLLLRDGKIKDFICRVDSKVKLVQHFLCGRCHPLIVHAELSHGFPAEEDILRHGHMRHQHQFLVNNGNTIVTGSIYAVNNNLFSVDADLAFLRDIDAAQHLDQRGFARTVLTQQRVDLSGFQLKLHIL